MEKTEIDFIANCPIFNCPNSTKPYIWTHFDCGGKEKINKLGQIRCCKCGEKGYLIDWNLDCQQHEYKEDSALGKPHALQLCSSLPKDPIVSIIISEITTQLRQCEEKQTSLSDLNRVLPVHNGTNGHSKVHEDIQQPIQEEKTTSNMIQLECSCPCQNCKDLPKRLVKWKHENCGGKLFLTIDAKLRCNKCKNASKLVCYRFDCKRGKACHNDGRVFYDQGTYLNMLSEIDALKNNNSFFSILTQRLMNDVLQKK